MTNGLARAAVRFRPASFVGSAVALLFASAIITACGVLLQTGVTAASAPARYAGTPVVVAADPYVRMTHTVGEEQVTVQAPLPERARVDSRLAARIAARPGVAAAVADIGFPVQPAGSAVSSLPPLTGRGYASATIPAPGAHALATGRPPEAGQVVLDEATVHAARLAVGDRIVLTAPGGSGTYRIAGVAPARAGAATVWFADRDADRLSGHPGRADAIAVHARAGVTGEELARQVRAAVGDEAKVLTGDARGLAEQPGLAGGKEALTALGASFGGVAAMTAVFVVVSTVGLAVGQRAREFALLRAVGATPSQIRRTVATEAAVVAPVAGLLGVPAGLVLARWWFDELVSRGAVPEAVRLNTGVLPMVVAVAVTVLAALIAGYLAARRPARLRPCEAFGEAVLEPRRTGRLRVVSGLALLAGGTALALAASGLDGAQAADTALGVVLCLLVAVALLGPPLTRFFVTVLGLPLRARGGASASLAADNARANARRMASATVPIAMVVAFCGTLLFLQTTIAHVSTHQVRTGIVADHVIGSTGPGLPATTAERAARDADVEASVGVLRTGVVYRADDLLNSATALGVSGDAVQLPKVLDLGVRTGSLSGLRASAPTVAVDEILAEEAGVNVGDRFELWLGDGTLVRPTVVATYERGLGLGQVLLPRAAVAPHVSAAYDTQVLIRDEPDAHPAAVAARLADLGPGLTVQDAADHTAQVGQDLEINAWANRVMAAVLGGFTAIAVANTLVMTVLARRREVGLLRLAGTTRGQVRGMMRWEALLVAATGLLLGTMIAYVTLVPITRGVTGSTPYVPTGTALPLAAGAVLLAVAATGLPTFALLRGRPLDAGTSRA
ncbi:ABC transporter permease [Streptomyces sp. NWU339]|uniref:FtsX-like permease family protein n=1 Tax=Streptomyces sp. NWU339 TaxID=2185284 RepID=UPI000D67ECC9|nr:FtsX-like permease family protein [Streptomyces sp. NWU339]PWI06732.1 ABC transporter permease [Streptomyces sp. NWU339]